MTVKKNNPFDDLFLKHFAPEWYYKTHPNELRKLNTPWPKPKKERKPK